MKPPRSHNHRAPGPGGVEVRLKEHALKLTGPRRAILEVLARQEHPRSIRELSGEMRLRQCDLATIYRAIHILEKIGVVKRFDFGDGIARFELVGEEGHHHHHLICTGCARVIEIEDCFPAELEQRIATGSGFKALSHKLEFFGVCPACQDG